MLYHYTDDIIKSTVLAGTLHNIRVEVRRLHNDVTSNIVLCHSFKFE